MNVKRKSGIDELLIEKQGVLEAIDNSRKLIFQREAELRIIKKRMETYEEYLQYLGKKIESARGWDVRS